MKAWIRVVFGAEAVLTAVLYGLFAYYIIYGRFAAGRPLIAYIYNLFFILVILLLDKLYHYYMRDGEFFMSEHSRFSVALSKTLFYTHFVSFKTALYLFYLAMLIVSRTAMLEPEIIGSYFRSFIHSVEYGILLLLPLDKFSEHLQRDDKRIFSIFKRLRKKNWEDIRSRTDENSLINENNLTTERG